MNWLAKVVAYKALSAIPGGGRLYNFGRLKITRSLIPSRQRMEQRINTAFRYIEILETTGTARHLIEGTHLDFGSGFHPTIPLLFYSLGCERQFLFDVFPALDEMMLDATITGFLEIANDPKWRYREQIKRLPERQPGRPLEEHLKTMGMSYEAPCSGSFSKIAGSIDVVTSTGVFQYIVGSQLKVSLDSISACLKNNGYFVGEMRLDDEYAKFDPNISHYNHLRYSPWVWENLINSRLMSYNRLKSPEYRTYMENAGLRIELFEIDRATPADLVELQKIPVHSCFAHYSEEELGEKFLTFAAIKP